MRLLPKNTELTLNKVYTFFNEKNKIGWKRNRFSLDNQEILSIAYTSTLTKKI
jgi:hypothetical protein